MITLLKFIDPESIHRVNFNSQLGLQLKPIKPTENVNIDARSNKLR